MKTRPIFLVLLIVCFACNTNNNPVSDAQKEKIKGEVKEVVNTIFKGCEEANFEMAAESCLDSPDFVYTINGNSMNYKQFVDAIKPVFSTLINQKITIIDEKYSFLDNSTVLYSNNCKWLQNYKEGHATLNDPDAILYIFKKIDNSWRLIYGIESFVEKNVTNIETSKELNQVELMKQWIGTWKCDMNNDTIVFWDVKSYGNGLEGYFKYVTGGRIVIEGKQLWGYDQKTDKYRLSDMTKGVANDFYSIWFTTKNTVLYLPFSETSNPENSKFKWEMEIKSPEMFLFKTFIYDKIIRTDTYKRIK